MSSVSYRERVWTFLEHPSTLFAYVTFFFLMTVVVISVIPITLEHFAAGFFLTNESWLSAIDKTCVLIFTLEYFLKVWAAPKRWKYIFSFYGLVDLLSIMPFYLDLAVHNVLMHDLETLRVLRLMRLLRLIRLLKLLKILHVLQIKTSIAEQVAPVVLAFVFFKLGISILEIYNVLDVTAELGQLFAIVGFALGIALGQNVRVAHQKFVEVEETALRIHALMISIYYVLSSHDSTKNQCDKIAWEWLESLIQLLERSETASKQRFYRVNRQLYDLSVPLEKSPVFVQLGRDYTYLNTSVSFILERMNAHIPRPFSNLLQRTTLIYIALMAVFVPGLPGLISVIVATYMLYGLYHVALDLDVAIADDHRSLMSVNIDDLRNLRHTLFHEDLIQDKPLPTS